MGEVAALDVDGLLNDDPEDLTNLSSSLLQRLQAQERLVSRLILRQDGGSSPLESPPVSPTLSAPAPPAANAASQSSQALTLMEPKSDLRLALRNYEPLAETLSNTDHTLPREMRCSHLAQYGDSVDFIAPAENMRRFFRLLHDESAISLAVHRVGNSLVLEGLEADPWARGGEAGVKRTPSDEGAAAEGEAGAPAVAAPLQLQHKALDSRFTLYSMGGASDTVGKGAAAAAAAAAAPRDRCDDESASDDDDDECGEWTPQEEPPRGFRRVLRWQLDDISMLLGSDTVVFHSPTDGSGASLELADTSASWHAPAFPVRLHASNTQATSLVCLDYWLDAALSSTTVCAPRSCQSRALHCH